MAKPKKQRAKAPKVKLTEAQAKKLAPQLLELMLPTKRR